MIVRTSLNVRLKSRRHTVISNEQEIKVHSPEDRGERIPLALGVASGERTPRDLWVNRDSRAGVYITREPREGIQRIEFVSRENES